MYNLKYKITILNPMHDIANIGKIVLLIISISGITRFMYNIKKK